jgi:hypothetical protein
LLFVAEKSKLLSSHREHSTPVHYFIDTVLSV